MQLLSSPTDWISVLPTPLISSSPLSVSSRKALSLMSSSYGHFLEIFDRYDRGTFSKGTASADEITPSSYFGGFRMLCGNKNKTLRAKAETAKVMDVQSANQLITSTVSLWLQVDCLQRSKWVKPAAIRHPVA